MTFRPLKTVLIGFGSVAAGYTKDVRMHKYYPYATHAEVLRDHPKFDWVGIVDPQQVVVKSAQSEWSVPAFTSIDALLQHCSPEVAIIAAPPQARLSIIQKLPMLRAVLFEKPLGLTSSDAKAIVDYCSQHSLIAAVNFWRRADTFFNRLANGLLCELIGEVQTIFGTYGNGLINNGSHMIDFVRFLCGDICSAQCVPQSYASYSSPIASDCNLAFNLILKNKIAHFQPINFKKYREVSLDLWGEKGRLQIVQEGVRIIHYPLHDNRSTTGAKEIASDQPFELESTVGYAFYEMYTNLADAVLNNSRLYSPISEGLYTLKVIDSLKKSIQAACDFHVL